jgi:hypothetical protein
LYFLGQGEREQVQTLKGWRCSSVVERLPSISKAQALSPAPQKEREKRKKKKKRKKELS